MHACPATASLLQLQHYPLDRLSDKINQLVVTEMSGKFPILNRVKIESNTMNDEVNAKLGTKSQSILVIQLNLNCNNSTYCSKSLHV